MKHHAYATEVATRWKRPARLSPKARKHCKFPPPDGREFKPPPVYDFITAVENSTEVNHWSPIRGGFNIAPAFDR